MKDAKAHPGPLRPTRLVDAELLQLSQFLVPASLPKPLPAGEVDLVIHNTHMPVAFTGAWVSVEFSSKLVFLGDTLILKICTF